MLTKTNAPTIKLIKGSLDEKDNGEIIGLGFLSIEDVVADNLLRWDTYQRGVLSNAQKLDAALKAGSTFPAVTLGLRGQNFDTKGDNLIIAAPLWIIDGLQRISATRRFAASEPTLASKIKTSVELRFNTDYTIEKQLFHDLNAGRIGISPNVHLFNIRDKYKAVASVYGFYNETSSPLHGRIQWGQRVGTGEIISAMTVVRVILGLYKHVSTRAFTKDNIVAGGASHVEGQGIWLENKSKSIGGLGPFRENLHTFFEVVDGAWGLRNVEHNTGRPYLRMAFLIGLATMFSEHKDFWKGNKLVVDRFVRERLKSFPFDRDDIAMMVKGAAGSGASYAWADMLTKHINRGRSTHKLTVREVVTAE